MAEHDVEAVWQDFWVPCLDNAVEGQPLGLSISIPGAYYEQIKRELYDYHQMMDGLAVLYDDITGGRATKPNTDKRVIARLVDERIDEIVKDRVDEEEWVFTEEQRDKAYWEGYDRGHADGRESGIDIGLEQARNSI